MRQGAVFAGRLSAEKGVRTLMAAWQGVDDALFVAGEGPLEEELRRAAPRTVSFAGYLHPNELRAQYQRARFLVVPSEWYEPFGRVVVEAYACGLPVLASRIGALPELVEDGVTGLLFEPGNADDMRAKIFWMLERRGELAKMGQAAREAYEAKYSPAANYSQLMAAYETARKTFARRRLTRR